MENLDFGMEMPTPCEHCGKIFDLNDGYRSEKWHKNVVICEKCYREEEAEIEEDERWEGINIDVSNALYELKEDGAWAKLTDENRALIIQLVSHSTIEKPPIGLKPKWLHDEQRQRECKEAIERYVNARRKVPQEWLDEYNSYYG
jgi:hypothetical protein